jgi:putative transposase
LTISHRGATSESTYFVTANVLGRKSLFKVDKIARLFIEVVLDYRAQKKYLLHDFVVMPDHFHLILTPTGITLERAVQFIKGDFSFQLNKNLKAKRDVWQDYIWQNPVKRFLAKSPEECPYSSANPSFKLDPVPQWLKPISSTALPQA